MSEFYVERQVWQRWPKVLLMCKRTGDGIVRRRYVPEGGMFPVNGYERVSIDTIARIHCEVFDGEEY